MKIRKMDPTAGELKHNEQAYSDFLDEIVDKYVDRLKREAEGADPKTVEKIKKELTTPTGDLKYLFSCQVDAYLSKVRACMDDESPWATGFVLNEIDRLLER